MADEVSLRDYCEAHFEAIDLRFGLQDKAVQSALTSAERAVSKAEIATEKRFDAVNEFRAALADSARLLMPRAESESARDVLSDKIDQLALRVNAIEDRTRGHTDVWGYVSGVLGLVIAAMTFAVMSVKH